MIKGEVREINATEKEKNLCRLRGDNFEEVKSVHYGYSHHPTLNADIGERHN